MPMRSLAEMQQYGFAIDIPWFDQLTEELTSEMDELRVSICSEIPEDKLGEFMGRSNMDAEDDYLPMNVESSVQLANLLFDVLGIGKGRVVKLTKGGDRASTGKKQLEQMKRAHPVVQLVLDYRERSKLVNTYTSKLPKLSKFHPDGACWCGLRHRVESYRVHTTLLTTRTTTGRLSSKSPNLQNISARSELGRRVRKGFIATQGTEIAGCDFSQAEMRLGAHYSQDTNLLRIFHNDLDPHTDTARRAFKTETPDKLTQRDPCKNVNFGIFYGLSGEGLYDLMAVTYSTARMDMPDWLTIEWCKDFIDHVWFSLYPGVRDYLDKQAYRAYRYNLVWTLFGRIRRIPEVRSVHKRVVAAGLRQAGNMPIQGSQADWMKLAIAEIQAEVIEYFRRDGVWCQPLMTVHDEMLVEVEEGYGEVVRDHMEDVMGRVMVDRTTGENLCRVKVKADGKVMLRWSK